MIAQLEQDARISESGDGCCAARNNGDDTRQRVPVGVARSRVCNEAAQICEAFSAAVVAAPASSIPSSIG
jgi:hypothetical protein